MKVKFLSLTLCLAALAGTASPGLAGGDWTDAGIKDYSASVPVPAPIPVPLYHPMWYFRVDGGFGFGDTAEATQSGMLFGDHTVDPGTGIAYGPDAAFSPGNGWTDIDYTSDAVWNLGIGYYWTSKFRTDVTVESRRTMEVDIDGSHTTDLMINGVGGVPGADTWTVQTDDHTIVRGAVFMLNGYYDFAEYGSFKPYIGAGVGFAITDLARKNDTSVSAVDSLGVGVAAFNLESNNNKDRQQVTSTALSATVGFSYALTDITDFDFGYRFLWVEGTHVDLPVIGRNSRIEIDDTLEHQIRAGLRFNVY